MNLTFPELTAGQWALVAGVVGLFLLITWWAIWDAFKREFTTTVEKMVWVQLAVMIPFLGGLTYLFFGKRRGKKIHGSETKSS